MQTFFKIKCSLKYYFANQTYLHWINIKQRWRNTQEQLSWRIVWLCAWPFQLHVLWDFLKTILVFYLIIVTNCDIVSSCGTRNLVLSKIGSCVSLWYLSTITYRKQWTLIKKEAICAPSKYPIQNSIKPLILNFKSHEKGEDCLIHTSTKSLFKLRNTAHNKFPGNIPIFLSKI